MALRFLAQPSSERPMFQTAVRCWLRAKREMRDECVNQPAPEMAAFIGSSS